MNERRTMERHQIALGFLGYLFIGTATVLVPTLMPFITNEFAATGLTLAAIGLIVPAGAAGGIVGTLLAGVGSDVLGHRRLVWLAALLLAAALALAAGATRWILFLLGLILVSVAQGALSTGINAMIADAGRTARARALNLLHGVYGVGAAASPLIIGSLIDRGLLWRLVLAGTGLLWLVYSLVVHQFYRAERLDTPGGTVQPLNLGMLRERPFLALFLIAFIYNGVAVSLLTWIALFTQESVGFSTFVSVSMISVFYVALTIGRFVCAAVAERLGYAGTLLFLAFGITLTYPLVVLGSHPLLVGAGVFLTGLSLSGLFPTALADGAHRYPTQTGMVSGTLNVALTLGSLVPPLWTGLIAEMAGLQVALSLNYGLVLLLIILARYLGRSNIRHSDTQPRPVSTP
jgi:fucose permease